MSNEKVNEIEDDQEYILVIEDNSDDVEIIKQTLMKCNVSNNIQICRDGDSALNFLNLLDEKTTSPSPLKQLPKIILLDLNLPGTDGLEVLEEIKSSNLCDIPVIILTTSRNERDVKQCYNKGANSYICKPDSHTEYEHMFDTFKKWWMGLVKLPKHL